MPGRIRPPRSEQISVRVASFNIRNGLALDWPSLWWRRRRSTRDAIRAIHPDILATQEGWDFQMRWLVRHLPNATERAGRGRSRSGGGERADVIVPTTRWRIEDSEVRWFGDEPTVPGSRLDGASHPRVATLARLVHLSSGVAVTAINTHLDQRSAQRRHRSVCQLVEWIERWGPAPVVMCGDFNAEVGDDELAPLLDVGLRPAVAAAEGPTAHAFGQDPHPRRLDHIFVSHHWSIVGGHVFDDRPRHRWPSDHSPIVADLALDGLVG